MIEIKNLTFSYKSNEIDNLQSRKQILKNINLTIKKGEFVAILGHNGSGKSTLAKHLNAILLPDEGDCVIDGFNTRDESNIFNIRASVGMVFQNPDNQMVAAVVEDDVAFAPENLGVPSEEIRLRVDECLKVVGMYEYRREQPAHLSGGQKQRVAIASVLAMNPRYIVLDEPTAMLDPQGREEVINTIYKLNKEKGMTVILITHYMEEAARADRVVVMDKGCVVLDDKPRNVFKEVERLKAIGLDVPQATEVAYSLRNKGINIPHIISVDECVDCICKALEGK